MWRRIAPAERDATAPRVLPPSSRVVARRTLGIALLALPLVAWIARAAGWPRLGDALAIATVLAALALLARVLGVAFTAAFAAGALALLGVGSLAGIPAVYGPPVIMNFAVAALFAASWWRGDPIVTRFARLEAEPLTPSIERYCARLTLVWAGYLVVLGLIGIAIAVHADERVGAWWSGVLDYLLVAALFVGELVYRRRSARGLLAQMRRVHGAMRRPPA